MMTWNTFYECVRTRNAAIQRQLELIRLIKERILLTDPANARRLANIIELEYLTCADAERILSLFVKYQCGSLDGLLSDKVHYES